MTLSAGDRKLLERCRQFVEAPREVAEGDDATPDRMRLEYGEVRQVMQAIEELEQIDDQAVKLQQMIDDVLLVCSESDTQLARIVRAVATLEA